MTEDSILSLSELLRTAGGLALVLGLILLAAYLKRRTASRGAERALKLLERLSVGRHAALILVQVKGRELLLATHEQGVTSLAEFEADELVEPPNRESEPPASIPGLRRGELLSFDAAVAAWIDRQPRGEGR